MNYSLLLHTLCYLRPTQLANQLKVRLIKPLYKALVYQKKENLGSFFTEWITKPTCLQDGTFSFLNLSAEFTSWLFTDHGMLWAYNLNYMDWLCQGGITEAEGCRWIDRFIEDTLNSQFSTLISYDPYPIALRCINWVKFYSKYPESATQKRLDCLYSQLCLLEQKLEYHLLGNHLLEDAYALYIGGAYLNDAKIFQKAERLLLEQLREQVLPDGAHYEQSPMYHCILLDRLLDCINIRRTDALCKYALRMLGHLESIVWEDGSIPLLNDSSYGIAPTPAQLFAYANRLGLEWKAIPLKECGYRKLRNERMEAVVDVGDITASYQPGHSHADVLNYELRIDGKPFVVDTGISTYNKTERRQYERSTAAHNCVVVDERDSSEVWSGFRVGKRSMVKSLEFRDEGIKATHDGFGKPCTRSFKMTDETLIIEDEYAGEAVSYIHLAPQVKILETRKMGVKTDKGNINVEGAYRVEVFPGFVSTEYNKLEDNKVIRISFFKEMKYTITLNSTPSTLN